MVDIANYNSKYMIMFIQVMKNRKCLFQIEKEVFEMLFNHTIARRNTKFKNACNTNVIKYDDFIKLSRLAEVPYPLFLLSVEAVHEVILEYEKNVYYGVSKTQLSIATRGEINLADISLILKDITRKQHFIKKHINTKNELSCLFKRDKSDLIERAKILRELLGYDIAKVELVNKEKSYNLLRDGLATKNVFISLYTDNYTPQRIERELQFSGIAINDKKCPFLFIKAGYNDNSIELWGRRLFTAALLLSCLCNGQCKPVTIDGRSGELIEDEHFVFAEEFLMPENYFYKETINSVNDVENISDKYSISSSAVIMRAFRLGMIDEQFKDDHLTRLRSEWAILIKKRGGGRVLAFEKAINQYNNPTVVRLILNQYHLKTLSARDVKNLLCYKKGDSFNIEALESYG